MFRVNHGRCPVMPAREMGLACRARVRSMQDTPIRGAPLLHSPTFHARRVFAASLATAFAVAVPTVMSTPVGAASPPKFSGAAWSKPIGPTHLSSPVIADVNGDGHLDVVTAD